VFQIYQIGSCKQTQLERPSVYSSSDWHLAFCALNPELFRCAKTVEARSVLRILFDSLAWIFWIFFLVLHYIEQGVEESIWT
jgi:hypothetical protein